jgi:hypothetical protein
VVAAWIESSRMVSSGPGGAMAATDMLKFKAYRRIRRIVRIYFGEVIFRLINSARKLHMKRYGLHR